ncbi:MAG: peptide-methionine (S)-S-oxide reductase MsrA [Pyrinomonadaceae bacterium]
MFKPLSLLLASVLAGSALLYGAGASGDPVAVPDPLVDAPLAAARGERVAVLAGGCFWGVDAVFKHVKGVNSVTSGYAGGGKRAARYEAVSTGTTGHAESVRIVYDPARVTYGQLLKVFFAVAHDPTELNRQGPDSGTQYRSAIFYADAEQKHIAEAYVEQLNRAKTFPRPVVTEVTALDAFHPAEAYHQNYLALHPDEPYIVINDLPKLEHLRRLLPELYVPGK